MNRAPAVSGGAQYREDAQRDHAAAESQPLETTPTSIPFAPRLRTAAIVPLAEADAKSTESFLLKYDFFSGMRNRKYIN
jgi:hypothetical protein